MYDAASIGNGILAGLVAITAPSDVVEPWGAICIGTVAAFIYSGFVVFIESLNIDDPSESGSIHYANGVWGIIACAIFDT